MTEDIQKHNAVASPHERMGRAGEKPALTRLYFYSNTYKMKLNMKKHILDKPILRNLFWFIVLPHNFKAWQNGHCKLIGQARTVGELREMLSEYDDNTSFGFRNQPMQSVHEIRHGNDKYVVFQ